MRVIHEIGKYVAVEDANNVERVRYQYQLEGDDAPSAPKPFCHPIRNGQGHVLTCEEPMDHQWHRGVWFTWKYVNSVNYWEERADQKGGVGRQVTLMVPQIIAEASNIRITSALEWRDSSTGPETARLRENRELTITLHDDGAMTLDWHMEQTALEDVTLDRTVFTTWGGYGGVVARMTQGVIKQRILFDDGTDTDRPVGEPHKWGGIHGQLDQHGAGWAAFVLMPSPQNRRYPEPFYGNAKPFFNFFGPAPLFYEPLPLAEGEILRHATRVLVLPRAIDPAEVNRHYDAWRAAENG